MSGQSLSAADPRHPSAPQKSVGLRWMYLLAALPTLTDLIETGHLPMSPRSWLTEVVLGLLILALVHRVRAQFRQAQDLARDDALTALGNRRSFDEALEGECARARRGKQVLSLVYIDLDRFKQVNDRLGHDAGDRVLRQLAAAMRAEIRTHVDRGFRIGGDEFALLLPGSSAAQAAAVVERIRARGAQSDPGWLNGPLGLSAGIVEFAPGETNGDFVRRADAEMYRRKLAARGAAAGT